MSPLQHALLFGGICFLAAVVIYWSCYVMAKRDGTLGGGR